ncbi:wolframin-like [Penaeus monodon]|uniref:wolframin-like n=1 Tax=Penaeus monodon TaxID=6687 RepID=UPI0018A737C0|nr:wolframin-like [Penaeus monodon]
MAATLPSDAKQHEAQQAADQAPAPEPAPAKRTARRQWSIQEGPRGILRRMRSQLAEDGCPESQLIIGKTLLEQISDENENDEEGARLAVYWLSRASFQGNTEATRLLQDCMDKNVGICEHNYHEVRECLAMDQQEKLARRAARMLFTSVSDGNDFITSSRLGVKMQEVLAGTEQPDDSGDSLPVDSNSDLEERYGGERFSEEHLVSAAVIYCNGRVPPIHHFMNQVSQNAHSHQILNGLLLPMRILKKVYQSCLQFLGVTFTNYVKYLLNILTPFTSTLIVCLISGLISLVGVNRAFSAFPIFISCISLLVMMVATAHLLLNRKHFDSFHSWSILFSHYCPELDIEHAEGKFKARCWKPYVALFLSVVIYLGTVPLVSPKLVICFLPVMYIFTVLTLFLVPEKLKVWQFISLSIYVMAVTPSVHECVSQWLFTLAKGTGAEELLVEQHIDIGWHVKLHLGIGPFLHLMWCNLQILVCVTNKLSILPPHLVTITWCHLAVMASYKIVEPSNLLYPLAAWSLIMMLPSIASLFFLFGPGLMFAYVCLHVGIDGQLALFVFGACIVTTCILKLWFPKLLIFVKLIITIGTVIAILHPDLILAVPKAVYSNLQWESYRNVCVPSKDSAALTVHGCLPLQGVFVKWHGSVSSVNIVSVFNLPEMALSTLPYVLRKPLRCYFGKTLSQCPSSKEKTLQIERCHMIHSVLGADACTLDSWNEYMFEVKVAMSSSVWKFGAEGSQVTLHADNTFQKFLLGLQIDDEIEFIGSLSNGIGTSQPSLHLTSVSCINCKMKLPSVKKIYFHIDFDVWVIPAFIFNFFMGPTLTI